MEWQIKQDAKINFTVVTRSSQLLIVVRMGIIQKMVHFLYAR